MYDSDILCGRCGKNDSGIVHSGTDGLWLGVLQELHKICYDCGNDHLRKQNSEPQYLYEDEEKEEE